MPLQPPERPEGTRCNVPVSAGIMSFPCTLGQGHLDHGEPHYAVESRGSVIQWTNWKQNQIDAEEALGTVSGQRTMEDVNADHARAAGIDPAMMGQPIVSQAKSSDREGRCTSEHSGIRCAMDTGHRTRHSNGTTHWSDHEADGVKHVEDVAVEPPAHPEPAEEIPDLKTGAHAESLVPGPTKVREGDQGLPVGGQECVQDMIIFEMQESKRIGTERYGQPLMTFNGRKGFQDVAEEMRDAHVYFAMIQREAQASRETLIKVAAEALHPMADGEDEATAEIIVDRLMGWVVGALNSAPTPGYVFSILEAWSSGGADLDFKGQFVPTDVQEFIAEITGHDAG